MGLLCHVYNCPTPLQDADEDIRLLDELSGLGMAMARDQQARSIVVGDAGEAADLALAFQRTSRSVRQTIALKAKLLRDQIRNEREDRTQANRETDARILIRKAQVRLSVERAVWNEADGSEAERLLDELDDLLEAETFNDAFIQGPAGAHIARLCDELGVTPLPTASTDLSAPVVGRGPRNAGDRRPDDPSGPPAEAPADLAFRQSSA